MTKSGGSPADISLPGAELDPPSETLADQTSHLKPFRELPEVLNPTAPPPLPTVAPLAQLFLPLIAHDLRSPLASILGYAAFLTDPTVQLPEVERNRYCLIIAKQAQEMARMLDELLIAAQIDAGQLSWEVIPVPLGALMAAVVADARQHSQRDIRLADSLSRPGTVARVMGDALGLRQAFLGLVELAIQTSLPPAPIHLILRQSATQGAAECIVADEGLGIAETEAAALFRGFGGAQEPPPRQLPAWGLRLYISNYIIQRLGGQVKAEARPTQGTRLIVTLPLVPDQDG